MSTRMKLFTFCFLSILFIGCDRVTKELAKTHLKGKESISYFNDSFRLQYAENTGAALGLGDDLPRAANFLLLSMLPLLLLIALIFYVFRNAENIRIGKLMSFCLIVAGGIGNIIDRIVYDRHVADFMNAGINDFRTGIFNFADVCVSAGAIGLILFSRERRIKHEGKV